MKIPGWQGLFECNTVYEDAQGAIWIGTRGGGAFKFDKGTSTVQYSPANGLSSGTVISFGEDDEGGVWVGTFDGGASLISKSAFAVSARPMDCTVPSFDRSRDREGNLLIGTNDGGLDIFKGDRFVCFSAADGLMDPQVWAVAEDDHGRAWFGTNGGIVFFQTRKAVAS
jgi:ligand-binding sensor domain-containing protein